MGIYFALWENTTRVFDDGVHGIGNAETVWPVVVRHTAVIFAHR